MWTFGLRTENLCESDEKHSLSLAVGKLGKPAEMPSSGEAWSTKRLLTCDEVPDEYHDKFIQTGYRQPGLSALESLKSLLQWNNETVNFWSHYITLLYFLWKFCSLDVSFFSDPKYWPLLCFVVGACGYPMLSCVAHTFSSMSPSIRHICFFCDYAGVSQYAIGTSIAIYAYSLPEHVQTSFPGKLFLPLNAIFAVASCMICCLSRDSRFRDKKPVMQTTAFAVPYAFIGSFILYRLLNTTFSDAVWFHYSQFFWALMIALSNTCKIPERFLPKKFDIVGQSHQWFHLFVSITTSQHTSAILLDIANLNRSSGVPVFSFMSSLGLMLFVLLLDFMIVVYFSWRMLQKKSKIRSD